MLRGYSGRPDGPQSPYAGPSTRVVDLDVAATRGRSARRGARRAPARRSARSRGGRRRSGGPRARAPSRRSAPPAPRSAARRSPRAPPGSGRAPRRRSRRRGAGPPGRRRRRRAACARPPRGRGDESASESGSIVQPSPTDSNGPSGVAPIRAASWALLPSVGCASSARWYARSDAFPRKSASSRPRSRASTTSGSFRQKSPWCTSTSSRADLHGALEELREHDTPQAIVVTSSRRRPAGPAGANSGKRSISRSSLACATISSLAATARVYGTGSRYPFAARGVAQPGSALRSGRRGPQFESGHPDYREGNQVSPTSPPSAPCTGLPNGLPAGGAGLRPRAGRRVRSPAAPFRAVSSLRCSAPCCSTSTSPSSGPGPSSGRRGTSGSGRGTGSRSTPRATRRRALGAFDGLPAPPGARPRRGRLDRVHGGHRPRDGR